MNDFNYGNYEDFATVGGGAFAGMLVFLFIIAIIGTLIGLAIYILSSLSLMQMANKKGIENAWIAWIPLLGQMYILGKIVDNVDISTYNVNKLDLVLLLGALAIMMLGWIPLIGQLLSLAGFIFMIFVFIKLYKMYAPESMVLYTVLSAIGLFFIPLLIIKNKDSIEVAATGNPVFK